MSIKYFRNILIVCFVLFVIAACSKEQNQEPIVLNLPAFTQVAGHEDKILVEFFYQKTNDNKQYPCQFNIDHNQKLSGSCPKIPSGDYSYFLAFKEIETLNLLAQATGEFTTNKSGRTEISIELDTNVLTEGTEKSNLQAFLDKFSSPSKTTGNDPVSESALDLKVSVNSPTQLDVETENDLETNAISYQWSFLSANNNSGEAINTDGILSDYSVNSPVFSPVEAGVYVLQLSLEDSEAKKKSIKVTITVEELSNNEEPEQPIESNPVVLATFPTSNSLDMDTNLDQISVTFNKEMASASINKESFQLFDENGGKMQGEIEYDSSSKTANFKPGTNLLANTQYFIHLSTNVLDENGNSLTNVFQSEFRTRLPVVSIESLTIGENLGMAEIKVQLDTASGKTVKVKTVVLEDREVYMNDILPYDETLTFEPGDTLKTAFIEIIDDQLYETNEAIRLAMENIVGANADNREAELIIEDDESLPTLSITDTVVNESENHAEIVLSISPRSAFPISVNYATNDVTALSAEDYTQVTDEIIIEPQVNERVISIPLLDDSLFENEETFVLNLEKVGENAVIGNSLAKITITDNDEPQFSIESGNGTLVVNWQVKVGVDTYNVYYGPESGILPETYSAKNGFALLNQDSSATIERFHATNNPEGVKLGLDYYFIVTESVNGIETLLGPELKASTVITPSFRLNDTGVLYGSFVNEFDTDENYPDCNGISIEQQDCSHGRDFSHNDHADGHAGFSFTIMDDVNTPRADQSIPYHAQPWECVKDNVTGLIWEVKNLSNDIIGEGLHDADDEYSWYNTNSNTNGGDAGEPGDRPDDNSCFGFNDANPKSFCNTEAFINRVNEAGWCGANNWRLPTRMELYSLMNFDKTSNIRTTIDKRFFPHAKDALHWTSTQSAGFGEDTWKVSFFDGEIIPGVNFFEHHVWLVSDGQ